MSYYDTSHEHQPITWLKGYPLYAAHFIVLGYVISMLVTAVIMAVGASSMLSVLPFSSSGVWRGEVWRVATYGLYNPPSLWFVIDMLMIVWFGRELEKFFGRGGFLRFYAALYFLTPAVFTIIGLWRPVTHGGVTGSFALFVAFATLYPNAVMLLNLLAKWVAAILVGLFTLMALSQQNWTELFSLWATVGFAHVYIRVAQGRIELPRVRLFQRRPKLRVLEDPAPRTITSHKSSKPSDADTMAEVDALLDKIAQSGLASLSAKERAKLAAAQERLKQKTQQRRS